MYRIRNFWVELEKQTGVGHLNQFTKNWSIYNKSIYHIDLKCLLNIFHWKINIFSTKKVSVRKGLERQDLATYLEAKIMDGNI